VVCHADDWMFTPETSLRMWHGTATNPIATAVVAILVPAMGLAAGTAQIGAAAVAGIAMACAIPFTRLSVDIYPHKLVIRLGAWGRPRTVFAIDEIDWAEHVTVGRSAVRFGVGYSGSRKKLRGRSILLRPGDALRFQGRGVRYTVTVDGALGAVATLDRLLPNNPYLDRPTKN
jgi:hypothetical protein